MPDWLYAVWLVWRVGRSRAFRSALRSVQEVACGDGMLMREKRAWQGLKAHCVTDPTYIENSWRFINAEQGFAAGLSDAERAQWPPWRQRLLIELAYVVYREQY